MGRAWSGCQKRGSLLPPHYEGAPYRPSSLGGTNVLAHNGTISVGQGRVRVPHGGSPLPATKGPPHSSAPIGEPGQPRLIPYLTWWGQKMVDQAPWGGDTPQSSWTNHNILQQGLYQCRQLVLHSHCVLLLVCQLRDPTGPPNSPGEQPSAINIG